MDKQHMDGDIFSLPNFGNLLKLNEFGTELLKKKRKKTSCIRRNLPYKAYVLKVWQYLCLQYISKLNQPYRNSFLRLACPSPVSKVRTSQIEADWGLPPPVVSPLSWTAWKKSTKCWYSLKSLNWELLLKYTSHFPKTKWCIFYSSLTALQRQR